ncbi:MAG TPA: hypothetical protein VN854_00620 [Mycoplasmatales bacterium]|jgi:hypothetical protein|nr:hypothetical protein [Mycoplasmatales bacterium]
MKTKVWYQLRWVIQKYRLGIISDKYSALINIMYPIYWRVINWDQVYFYQELALLIFKKKWQQKLIFYKFFELYDILKNLTWSTSYLRYLTLLNIFFFIFTKKYTQVLVDILINLNTKELIWIIWMFKEHVNYLQYWRIFWELLLNVKFSLEKKFQTNWKLLYNLFFYYKLIEERNNSNKYKLDQTNAVFVWSSLYLFELFLLKLNTFVFKIWSFNIIFVNFSIFNILENKEKIGLIFFLFSKFSQLNMYMLNFKEAYTLKESNYFLEKITYFEFFREITWIKLYFKLSFKLSIANK